MTKNIFVTRKPQPKKTFFFVLCFFVCLAACAQTPPPPHYATIPDNPRPGEPITIGVTGLETVSVSLYTDAGKRLSRSLFFAVPKEGKEPELRAAIITVPSTAEPGAALIKIEDASGVVMEIPISIREREFVSEIIPLNETLTGIRTAPDPQKTAESDHLWAILSTTGSTIYWTGNFVPPLTSTRRTSFFGDRRVYRYSSGRSDTSVHAGIDYGVPTGTPISACAAGKVVLARPRIVTGNSVVIEHLPGLYSLYYHLDKIEIEEGALVEAGTLIGKAGSTGLATGPHLHWEIRVSGENTDPDAFLAWPILDKEAILHQIENEVSKPKAKK